MALFSPDRPHHLLPRPTRHIRRYSSPTASSRFSTTSSSCLPSKVRKWFAAFLVKYPKINFVNQNSRCTRVLDALEFYAKQKHKENGHLLAAAAAEHTNVGCLFRAVLPGLFAIASAWWGRMAEGVILNNEQTLGLIWYANKLVSDRWRRRRTDTEFRCAAKLFTFCLLLATGPLRWDICEISQPLYME